MATITPDTGARYFSKIFGDNHAAPAFQYIWDSGVVWRNGVGLLQTGAARPVVPSDLGTTSTVSVSGLSLTVGAVNLTGVNVVTLTGITPVFVTNTNPLATSGFFTPIWTGAPNVTASVSIGNIAVTGGQIIAIVSGLNPIWVTGTFSSTPAATAITGNPGFTVTGWNTNITVNVAVTGFPSTIAPLAVSGFFTPIWTGAPNVTASVSIGNVAVTGGNINVTDNLGWALLSGISGTLATNLSSAAWVTGSGTQLGNLDLTRTYLPISGINTLTTNDTAGNLYLASISGTLVTLLSDNVAITGGMSGSSLGNLDVTRTYLPISGVGSMTVQGGNLLPIYVTGLIDTRVTGSISSTISNPIGVSGVAIDRALPIIGGFATQFLPMGGRVVNPSGAGSITGYNATGDMAILNIAPNGGVYTNQGCLDPNQDIVSIIQSGSITAPVNSVSGLNASFGAGGFALAANPNRLAWGVTNMSTGIMFGRMGINVTTGNAHFILKGGTTQMDGNGAVWIDSPAVWKGVVSITGNFSVTPAYSIWEI